MQANLHMGRNGAGRVLRRTSRRLTIATTAFALIGTLGALSFMSAAPSRAGECNVDIGNLMKKRQAVIDELNRTAKASPKGQLDPALACGKLRNLAAAERELLAYMTKNKDWCMVPENAITNLETGQKRSAAMAGKACQVAEQVKKNQETVGTGPKLPAGPL